MQLTTDNRQLTTVFQSNPRDDEGNNPGIGCDADTSPKSFRGQCMVAGRRSPSAFVTVECDNDDPWYRLLTAPVPPC